MDLKEAKKINIEVRGLFNEYFRNYPPEISEFTFSNLFIWKEYYNYEFIVWKDHIVVFSRTYLNKWRPSILGDKDVLLFLPPIGENPREIIYDIFTNFKNVEIHRVPESIIQLINSDHNFISLKLTFKSDRDNWDYVYEREKLISLPGNEYRQKRRNLKKFTSTYDYDFHLVEDKFLESCKELQSEWCDMNECQSNEDLQQEHNAIFTAFDYYEKLELRGGLILVDNKCVAYTIGEKLNKDTMVIHFEKAHIDYEGSYQAINNYFAKDCCKNVIYVNREQDLGIPGIRYAKESYKPHHMVKKYIIFRNS